MLRFLPYREPRPSCENGRYVCEVIRAHRQTANRVKVDPEFTYALEQRATGRLEILSLRERSFAVDEVTTQLTRSETHRLIKLP